MTPLWVAVLVFACASAKSGDDTCAAAEQDPTVYLFGYGSSFGPYEYLNEDGELMGLGYDITRSVCKIMNKKCEHSVYYDYALAYNDHFSSIALNDNWYHALASWVYTKERISSYDLGAVYAHEPAAYIFVKSSSNQVNNIDDVKHHVRHYGFRTGFRTDENCLGKYLDMSLSGKAVYYDSVASLEAALASREVDAIFVDEIEVTSSGNLKRLGSEPIRCSSGGMSIMYRKDTDMAWFSVGLKMLMDNGDYEWICNMNSHAGDPGCL